MQAYACVSMHVWVRRLMSVTVTDLSEMRSRARWNTREARMSRNSLTKRSARSVRSALAPPASGPSFEMTGRISKMDGKIEMTSRKNQPRT